MRKVIAVLEIQINVAEGKSSGDSYFIDVDRYHKWVEEKGGINDPANRFISHIIEAALKDDKAEKCVKSNKAHSFTDQPCWYKDFMVESIDGYDKVIKITNKIR